MSLGVRGVETQRAVLAEEEAKGQLEVSVN